MAKSEYSIRMDFKNTIKKADKLESLSGKMERIAENDLVNTRSNLSYNWKGDNAAAYMKKVQTVEGDISSIAKNLSKTSDVLREIAQKTYEAEMRALERARRRNY